MGNGHMGSFMWTEIQTDKQTRLKTLPQLRWRKAKNVCLEPSFANHIMLRKLNLFNLREIVSCRAYSLHLRSQ